MMTSYAFSISKCPKYFFVRWTANGVSMDRRGFHAPGTHCSWRVRAQSLLWLIAKLAICLSLKLTVISVLQRHFSCDILHGIVSVQVNNSASETPDYLTFQWAIGNSFSYARAWERQSTYKRHSMLHERLADDWTPIWNQTESQVTLWNENVGSFCGICELLTLVKSQTKYLTVYHVWCIFLSSERYVELKLQGRSCKICRSQIAGRYYRVAWMVDNRIWSARQMLFCSNNICRNVSNYREHNALKWRPQSRHGLPARKSVFGRRHTGLMDVS